MKKHTKRNLVIFILVCILWLGVTNAIYQFKNPEKTETEAFLHIPKSILLDFE